MWNLDEINATNACDYFPRNFAHSRTVVSYGQLLSGYADYLPYAYTAMYDSSRVCTRYECKIRRYALESHCLT